jgi:hypothetical protein
MANQGWVATANGHGPWHAAAGPSVTGQTDLEVSPQPTFTFAAGAFAQGDMLRVTANGMVTVGSTATNGTWKVWMGATAPTTGDAVLATGALALLVSQTTPWRIEANITIRAAGAAGTAKVWCQGVFMYGSSATVTTTQLLPLVTPALTGTNLSTSLVQGIWLTANLSQATGAPAATCQQFMIEALN